MGRLRGLESKYIDMGHRNHSEGIRIIASLAFAAGASAALDIVAKHVPTLTMLDIMRDVDDIGAESRDRAIAVARKIAESN